MVYLGSFFMNYRRIVVKLLFGLLLSETISIKQWLIRFKSLYNLNSENVESVTLEKIYSEIKGMH